MKKFQSLGRSLSKAEQKMVNGGVAQPTCQAEVPTEYGYAPVTGLNIGDAKLNASTYHTHWCCDSCCTATWADHTGCAS